MTFTHTVEFDVPENILRKMTSYAIIRVDDGIDDVREAVYSAYITYIRELPNGISSVYEKLEAELVDRVTEYFCEEAFGEED